MGKEEVMPHDERYTAAEEYMEIVYQWVEAPSLVVTCTKFHEDSGRSHAKTVLNCFKKNLKWHMTLVKSTK